MNSEEKSARGGSSQVTEALATKVCPQCGQVLFADMDVCYGCLHDFSREVDVGSLGLPVTLLEHLEPKHCCLEDVETGQPLSGERKEAHAGGAVAPDVLALHVRSDDVELTVPLPSNGVMVGRLSRNDVVLHARSVSRHHVLIIPCDGKAQVIDQGATNPALLDGVEVTSSAVMGIGDVLDVCGVLFSLVKVGGGVTDVS